MNELPDPRVRAHPAAHDAAAASIYALAEASLHAVTGQEADASDARIAAGIAGLLARSDGKSLARLLDHAPTIAIYRHVWRVLTREAGAARAAGDALGVTLFAIPIVIVARATNPGATVRACSPIRAQRSPRFANTARLAATGSLRCPPRWPPPMRSTSTSSRRCSRRVRR